APPVRRVAGEKRRVLQDQLSQAPRQPLRLQPKAATSQTPSPQSKSSRQFAAATPASALASWSAVTESAESPLLDLAIPSADFDPGANLRSVGESPTEAGESPTPAIFRQAARVYR